MSLLRTVTIADVFGSPNDWITPVTRGMGLRLRGSTSGYVGLKAPASGAAVDFTLPSADGSSGQAIITNGSGVLSFASVTTSPGGSSGELQYNNAGAFAGIAGSSTSSGNLCLANNKSYQIVHTDGSSKTVVRADNANTLMLGRGGWTSLQVASGGNTTFHDGSVINTYVTIKGSGTTGAYLTSHGQLSVTAQSATTEAVKIQLAATPTANAIEVNSLAGSGGDIFKVSATGAIYAPGSISTISTLRFTTSGSTIFRDMSARVRIANYEGTEIAAIQTNAGGAGLTMLKPIGFSTTYTSLGTVAIDRDADGVLAVHNGTAGQYRDVKLRAIELVDGNLIIGTTTGTKIGTATTQKLGFWNATPVVQPASANQTALTDSTGGTADGTVAAVSGSGDDATINNNFKEVLTLLNQLRADLVSMGLIKGSA